MPVISRILRAIITEGVFHSVCVRERERERERERDKLTKTAKKAVTNKDHQQRLDH